jgi:type 1 glutamine amidotransferase
MSDLHTRSGLVVRGGWEGHSPVEATESFLPFLKAEGFEVRVEDTTEVYTDRDYMATVDLVVQCNTMNTIEGAEFTGLAEAVTAGTGLAGWHGGIADAYRSTADYLHLIGGQFAHHPIKAPRTELTGDGDHDVRYTVNIVPTMADHTIVAGIADFELVTEQYWVLTDEYNDVLATTTLAARDFDPWHRPVTCPAVWTREWGEGRVFVTTAGHSLDVLADANVRTIIERGMLWASR